MVSTSDLLSQKMIRSVFVIIFLLLAGQLPGPPSSVFATGPPPQESPSESELEEVTLQLRWFHQFQFAGYYAAESQGYYRDAGLKVNIVEGDPTVVVNTYEEVLAGRAQYGASNTEVLLERMAGKPLVVLAAIFQHSPYVMIAPRSSGITNLQDLAGRRINMLLGPRTAEMQAALISEGVPLEKVTIVSTPGDFPDYLFDESFDAFGGYETNEPFFLEQAGIPLTFIRPRTYGIDFYGDVLYTSETELADHPDRVRRFREASLKGWQYAMDHPDEIIDLILAEYGSPKSREHLAYEAEQMRRIILPDLVELGHMNPGRWAHIAETYVELDMAEPGYTLDGFIYDPQPEPDNSRFYVALGIIGVLLLVTGLAALILWLFNRRLRAAVARQTQEIRQSQAALRQSEERYRAVWDIAADAMALSDPDGIVIDANPAYLALYGYSASEVIGHSFAIIFPDERRDWAVEQYKATFANPEISPGIESQIRRSDGTERSVETHIGFVESDGRRRLMLSSVRDISTRKQAEAALAESEERFRLIVENTREGFWLREFPEDQITYVSPGLERVYGYPAATIMYEENWLIEEAVLPEYRAQIKTARQRIRTQGEPLNVTVQARQENGDLAWIWVRSYPVYDGQGELNRIVGIAEDVTERKQMEAALKESEELHRVTMENVADPIFITDDVGNFTFICPNIPHVLGYSTAEVAAMGNISTLLGEDVFDREALAAAGYLPNIERTIVDKAGNSDKYLISVKRVTIGAGRVLYTCRNVTELKQAEQALADSEEKHRLLFENAGAGIGYYTPAGEIIAFNKLACEQLAGQPEDFAGKHVQEVFGEAAGAVYQERITRTVNSDATWTHEDCVQLPIGERWFLSQYTRITNKAGQVTGVQIIAHDITELKQTEAKLRERERFNRAIADTAPALLYIYDVVGERNIWANASYGKILGIGHAGRMSAQEVFSRVHPDDVEQVIQQTERLLRSESDDTWQEVELRFQVENAGWVWLFLRLSVFKRDEAGSVIQILGAGIDITERKKAEQALRRYERIVWTSPDFLSMIDRDYVYRIVNNSYVERAGKSNHEIVGRSVAELMGEEVFHSLVKPELDRCLAGETIRYQAWFDFPGERRGFMDVTYFPYVGEDGAISGVVVSNRDITELKLARTALQESEKNLRALIDATDESVLLMEPNGTIIECNEGVARRFGQTRDDLVGTNSADLVGEVVAAHRQQYAEQVIASGQPVRFEDEQLGRMIDNSIYPVLDEAGQVVRLAYFGRDITEQVQAEAARRESEAKNRALLEAIPDLMFRLTRDGEIIDFRANHPEELLLEPAQVLGSRLCDTMPPEVCSLVMARIEQALETGQMQIFEYQLPVQRGLQDFEARLSVSGEDDVLAIVRNVTDLKQAQQALRESEANLRALIENTDGVIWALDHDYRLIAANSTYYDNMRAAFGRQLQPGDRSLADDFPADAVAQWRAYYDRALRGERFSVEHGTRYQASKQYFEYWFSSIQTSEGQVIGATIYGRDITGRKVAEEALQASEKRYRHLFEDAQDAILITDDEQRFVEVNPAACALLGYSREELLALGVPDVVPETIRESIRQRGQEFRRAGRQAGEFTLLRKDGSQMETEYRSVANFVPGLSMAFFRDITERKTYEQNLKTALDEKETLLQELYHRTKNNMQVISSMLTLQMGYTEDKLVKRIFEETSNKIKSMAMVHQKLYQSQNLSSIDLAEYIKDLVALLVHSYGERAYGVKISLDLASVPVLIDIAIPCGLLLNELISNVFKHAFPEGEPGTLNIRLRRLADGAIVLGVSDDGAGFPPDFDVENDGRLGLTLISTLAERQLDGEMTFEGDTGVTFEVRFRDTQYQARV